jgi:hypothetical protein
MNKIYYALSFIKEYIEDHVNAVEALDDKLTLLTEVFLVTEEIRYKLCEGHTEMEKGGPEHVRGDAKGRDLEGNRGLPESTSGNGEA